MTGDDVTLFTDCFGTVARCVFLRDRVITSRVDKRRTYRDAEHAYQYVSYHSRRLLKYLICLSASCSLTRVSLIESCLRECRCHCQCQFYDEVFEAAGSKMLGREVRRTENVCRRGQRHIIYLQVCQSQVFINTLNAVVVNRWPVLRYYLVSLSYV